MTSPKDKKKGGKTVGKISNMSQFSPTTCHAMGRNHNEYQPNLWTHFDDTFKIKNGLTGFLSHVPHFTQIMREKRVQFPIEIFHTPNCDFWSISIVKKDMTSLDPLVVF